MLYLYFKYLQLSAKTEDSHVKKTGIKVFTVLLLLKIIEWTYFINLLSNLTEIYYNFPDAK